MVYFILYVHNNILNAHFIEILQLSHCEANQACKSVNPNSTLAKLNIRGEPQEEMQEVLLAAGILK